MRRAFAIAVLSIGCGPAGTAAPIEPPMDTSRVEVDAEPEPHVVIVGGTPLFDARDAARPRGWLGKDDDIGGWTMRLVDDAGDRLHVRAELDPAFDHCARDLDGASGLGIELFVPRSALATVITREVTLTAEDCDAIVVRPGVMVTALCEQDGVKRYRVGSCPNASCLYAVPEDAIGHTYVAGHRSSAAASSDPDVVAMPCIDGVEASGARRPYGVTEEFGGIPAIGLSPYGRQSDSGELPACELSTSALSCDIRPRLGFDHVEYELDEDTKVAWRDGTPAGIAARAHRFRAVPHDDGDRVCWGAVEGESSDEDLMLCAPADAVHRVEEPHAVVLQAQRNGERTRWFDEKHATACYGEALAKSPGLAGRVHASFRVGKDGTTLERVTRPGDEAFARCLARRLAQDERAPHALELTIELYPGSPTTRAGG
jgi:hypothetical protein